MRDTSTGMANGRPSADTHSSQTNGCAHHDTGEPSSHSQSTALLVYKPFLLPTKTKDEVPVLFREPYVETGFRALDQPWYYYICTMFQLHNEMMNVWTHVLAFILMAGKLYRVGGEVDFVGDPYTWPLLAGFVCGMALYAFSSGAHCMQSKSELVHYVAFMVDYAGIGLYGLGSVIIHLAYCSEDDFYYGVDSFFIPLGSLFAFLICCCCTMAKVMYSRPYPFTRKLWQMSPVLGIYVLLIAPILHRLHACYAHGEDCNDSIPYHVQQIFWFVTSGLFFASDFPQRFKPGTCDIFFHSHQLFHFCIMICTLRQMDGVYIDFTTRHDVIYSRPKPSFASAFGPVLIVLAAEVTCIVCFAFKLHAQLHGKDKTKKSD